MIENQDIKIIEEIAKKYNMSLVELGKLLTKNQNDYVRMQILYNDDEINYIDEKVKSLKISRSQYCRLCYKKALKDKLYENIDILKVLENENKKRREYRAVISFDSSNDYLEMKYLAENIGVPFSSLMRYFSLNIEL